MYKYVKSEVTPCGQSRTSTFVTFLLSAALKVTLATWIMFLKVSSIYQYSFHHLDIRVSPHHGPHATASPITQYYCHECDVALCLEKYHTMLQFWASWVMLMQRKWKKKKLNFSTTLLPPILPVPILRPSLISISASPSTVKWSFELIFLWIMIMIMFSVFFCIAGCIITCICVQSRAKIWLKSP